MISIRRRRGWSAGRPGGAAAGFALLLLLGVMAGAKPAGTPSAGTADARARSEEDVLLATRDDLRREMVLVERDSLYLDLDPEAGTLTLVLGTVALQQYGILALELAPRRFLWVERPYDEAWATRLRFDGRITPGLHRRTAELHVPPVEAPAGDATPADLERSAPPLPLPEPLEKAVPVPAAFRIRYGDGLTLVVRPRPEEGRSPLLRIRDALRARFAEPRWSEAGEELRLRVTLPAAEYAHLYRVLPPDVDLLVRTRPSL